MNGNWGAPTTQEHPNSAPSSFHAGESSESSGSHYGSNRSPASRLGRPASPYLCLLAMGALLGGCQAGNRDLFPVSEGQHWNYLARTVNATLDRVSYVGRTAVGSTEGYVLKGDLGVFHVAWLHGELVTDQMAGSRMEPPLPILTPVSTRPVEWRGWIDTGDKREPAKAQILTEKAKLPLHGLTVDTTRSLIVITLPQRQLNLVNWYKAGVGLVRQEQRTNGRLDLILDYLDQS